MNMNSLESLTSIWIISVLFQASRQVDIPMKYYDVSRHAGEEIELKCESEEPFTSFMWSKRDGSRWTKFYKSFGGGFQGDWGRIFRLNGSNIITNNLTENLGGKYICSMTDRVKTISEISLKVLEPCPSIVCPDFKETPCVCPTLPTFPPKEALTTKVETTVHRPKEAVTTAVVSRSEEFRVECDKSCSEHDLLLCRRDKWILRCEEADLTCNSTATPMEQLAAPRNPFWQTILHLSLHGFLILVILALLVYIYYLKRMINHIKLTSIIKESYTMPMSFLGEDPHKYATQGNTYDFIADVRPKDEEYSKYLKLKSAKDYELPPIPDYLEVVNS